MYFLNLEEIFIGVLYQLKSSMSSRVFKKKKNESIKKTTLAFEAFGIIIDVF